MAQLRSITPIVVALAVLLALSGCGGGDDSSGIDTTDAEAIEVKLAQVEERAITGRCTGDDSALSSLTSLNEFVASDALNYVSDETRADLEELLARLGEQIQSQCEQVSDLTTTTTTDTTDTDTTTTDTETTTDRSSTTRETTDTTTRETTTTQTPPNNGGNQGGGNTGGGNQGGGNQGGGSQGGGPAPPSDPDGSGGIGPGVIGPIFRSATPGSDSVLPSDDDSAQADPGASR